MDCQKWSRGHKARGQGHKKKSEVKDDKDSPSEDRPYRGQEQECSMPRTKDTSASVLQKNNQKKVLKIFFQAKRKGLQIFFQATSKKKVFKIFFWRSSKFSISKNTTVLQAKDVLENSTSGDYASLLANWQLLEMRFSPS